MKRFALTGTPILICALIVLSISGCERIKKTKENISGLKTTIESTKTLSRLMEEGKTQYTLSEEEVKELVIVGNQAIEKAKNIDYEFLNKMYPDLGNKFEQNLVEGVSLVIKGYEEKNEQFILEGKKLIETWVTWFDENVDKIKPLAFLKNRSS